MAKSQRMTDEEARRYLSLPPRVRYRIAKAAGHFECDKEFLRLRELNAQWEAGSPCDPMLAMNDQLMVETLNEQLKLPSLSNDQETQD